VTAASKLVPDSVVQLITASGTPDEYAPVGEYVRQDVRARSCIRSGADVGQMIVRSGVGSVTAPPREEF
jgi:hypothetical protein